MKKYETIIRIDEVEFYVYYELIGDFISETRECPAEKPDVLITKVSVSDSEINLLGFLSNIHIDAFYYQIENNL